MYGGHGPVTSKRRRPLAFGDTNRVSKLIRRLLFVVVPCAAGIPCGSWHTEQGAEAVCRCRLCCLNETSERMLVRLWHL